MIFPGTPKTRLRRGYIHREENRSENGLGWEWAEGFSQKWREYNMKRNNMYEQSAAGKVAAGGAAVAAESVFGAGGIVSAAMLEDLPTPAGIITFLPHPPIPVEIAVRFLKSLFEDDDETDEDDGEKDAEIKGLDIKQYGNEGKGR